MRNVVIALLAGGLALRAQGPVPRPAPDLKIGTAALSSWRGHVVLLAFISTECPHCQRVSGVFEQLLHEFAGLRVAELAFNDGADTASFRKRLGLSFLVGTVTTDLTHDYLGIARGARLGTPQVVVIDRSGLIRAQSERLGSPILQTHDYLYALLKAVELNDRPLAGNLSGDCAAVPLEAGLLSVRVADADWVRDDSRLPISGPHWDDGDRQVAGGIRAGLSGIDDLACSAGS